MKVVLQNVRQPRKYTELRSLSLCDDQGITWARIHVSWRGVEVDHLEGANIQVKESTRLGDWDLDGEFKRGYSSRRNCPKCQERATVYDRQNQVVKCKKCGEVY